MVPGCGTRLIRAASKSSPYVLLRQPELLREAPRSGPPRSPGGGERQAVNGRTGKGDHRSRKVNDAKADSNDARLHAAGVADQAGEHAAIRARECAVKPREMERLIKAAGWYEVPELGEPATGCFATPPGRVSSRYPGTRRRSLAEPRTTS